MTEEANVMILDETSTNFTLSEQIYTCHAKETVSRHCKCIGTVTELGKG